MNLARYSLIAFLYVTAASAVGSAALMLFTPNLPDYFLSNSSTYYFLLLFLLFFAILAALVNMLHRRAFRSGGIYLSLIFILAWDLLLLSMFNWIDGNKWEGTFFVSLGAGIPAGVGLLFWKKPWGPPFATALTSLATVAGVVMLIPIWISAYSEAGTVFIYSGITILVYGAVGSVLLINVGCGDQRYFRWPAVAVALLGLVLGLLGTMAKHEWNDLDLFWSRLCGLLAGTFAFINILLMTRRAGLVRVCKGIAIAAVVMTGLFFTIYTVGGYLMEKLNYQFSEWQIHWLIRSLGASIFISMGAILCELITRAMVRLGNVPTAPTGIERVALTCPNCKVNSEMPLKDGACPNCLLQFRLALVEPRCPRCEHLLLNLTSARCPECGMDIQRPGLA